MGNSGFKEVLEKQKINAILKAQKIEEFYQRADVLEFIKYLNKFKNDFNSKSPIKKGIKSFKIIFEDDSEIKEVKII